MDKKDFFNFDIDIDKSKYLKFLRNDDEILKENSNWLIWKGSGHR